MSVLERVQQAAETLTPSERELVKQLIANPRDIALATASELANRVGVHEATASRLARKLGYPSYSGFRNAIREEFIVRTDPAVRVRNTLDQTAGGDLLADLIGREIEALTALPRYVDMERLTAAARVLLTARRAFVFARGNAEALGVQFERRLRRMGRQVVPLRGDARDCAEQILAMDAGDALVGFVFRRQPGLYAPLLEHVRALGAQSVVVSDSIGPSLAPKPGQLLFAPRSGSQEGFQTLTVPMAITNALVLAMAAEDKQGTLGRLETLGQLIASFGA